VRAAARAEIIGMGRILDMEDDFQRTGRKWGEALRAVLFAPRTRASILVGLVIDAVWLAVLIVLIALGLDDPGVDGVFALLILLAGIRDLNAYRKLRRSR
jgi:hypothetical protein